MRNRINEVAFVCVVACFLAFIAPMTASGETALVRSESGFITGQVFLPDGLEVAIDLFFENLETDVVVVVPLDSGQESYSATVPEGSYRAYVWLPDFSLMGVYSACQTNQPCNDHSMLPITVRSRQSTEHVDIVDWHVPETRLVALSGRLFDGTGADPVDEAVLIMWDQHIVAVGPASELEIPGRALHHNLAGTTILPGFINTHVHNAYRAQNLEAWALAGVTTVRDVGAPVTTLWDYLRTLLDDQPRYARILASGPLVTCPGGYPIAGNDFPSLTVDSEDEVQREINSLIDRGADVIKIVIESNVGELLSEELATAIVNTAHLREVPVTVHLVVRSDLSTALNAGVDDIAHIVVDYVSDELISRMVDEDVAWVPTLAILNGNGTQMFNNLKRFVQAGGRVALGNDSGYLPGVVIGMPMPEIEAMESADMTPTQIIVASTSDAAIVCRQQDLLGTLKKGMLADVLVVQGDPLNDLRALQDVRMVIHAGTIIRRENASPRRPEVRIQ